MDRLPPYCYQPPPEQIAGQPTCRCVDWYTEGKSRMIDCDGVRIIVRYVGRSGRRGRILIESPPERRFLWRIGW